MSLFRMALGNSPAEVKELLVAVLVLNSVAARAAGNAILGRIADRTIETVHTVGAPIALAVTQERRRLDRRLAAVVATPSSQVNELPIGKGPLKVALRSRSLVVQDVSVDCGFARRGLTEAVAEQFRAQTTAGNIVAIHQLVTHAKNFLPAFAYALPSGSSVFLPAMPNDGEAEELLSDHRALAELPAPVSAATAGHLVPASQLT